MSESLKELSLFTTVVECGGFASSADVLGLTPSAISKAIARLEHRLGAKLFTRSTRTIKMTEAGSELYQRGQVILAAIEDAEEAVSQIASSPRGELYVSCSDAFASLVLVPMLKSFHQTYPEIAVHITQGDGPMDLVKEDYDLAIRFEAPPQKGLNVLSLIPDPWVICASPEYLASQSAPTSPTDLQDHACLAIRARSRLDDTWTFRGGKRHTIAVAPVFSGIGMVVKEAALNGLGVARLANFLVAKDIDEGRLVSLLDNYQLMDQRSIFAVTPDRGFVPAKTRVFTDALIKHLAHSD